MSSRLSKNLMNEDDSKASYAVDTLFELKARVGLLISPLQ